MVLKSELLGGCCFGQLLGVTLCGCAKPGEARALGPGERSELVSRCVWQRVPAELEVCVKGNRDSACRLCNCCSDLTQGIQRRMSVILA